MAFTIYGPSYSTYVRSARLTLEEKGAAYELVEVDMLKGETQAPAHLARHPFARVPAFAHDGFDLYETAAIVRYVDRVAPGPALQPADPKGLARMDQIIAIIDAYAYPAMITKLVMQRSIAPMMGEVADEAVIESAKPHIRTSLAELERLMGSGPFLVGGTLSLADLMLAPIFAYFTGTPESAGLLAPHGKLRGWWTSIAARPSVVATAPRLG